MVYGTYYYSYWGLKTNKRNWGGHHLVISWNMFYQDCPFLLFHPWLAGATSLSASSAGHTLPGPVKINSDKKNGEEWFLIGIIVIISGGFYDWWWLMMINSG